MAHRPIILKLATKISLESLTYMGITYDDPEYRILEPIVTDAMAEICLHVTLNKGRTVEEIARRADKPVRYTQARLDELVNAGIVRCRYDDGVKSYYYPIWVPGIMEGILANREQCDANPVIGECFEEYTRRRPAILATNMGPGMGPMRVIPVDTAIESESRAATYDEVSHLIETAHTLSVGACSCRRSRRLMGEGCGHLEEDMCMYLNDNAKTFIENGLHRQITKEEAYEILKRAEDNGLVHEINKTDGWDEVGAICNCCGCSCYALRFANYFHAPDMVRSNFVAKVEKEKCVACGQCVENCQVNALKLGRKLCAAEPLPEKAPEDTPADTIWTKDHYNVDYRTNRTDVVDEGTAPCKVECPAHIPVQGYIKLASQGKYLEALELIKTENPFPAVCGRICNKKCEQACTRGDVDDPIAIDDIKKFIADKELDAKTRFVPKLLNQIGKPYPQKVAVIGAGPAGLSCAYYLAVKGYPVTVFEKEEMLGGMLTMGIPNFRLEKDVVNAEIDVLRELGVEFKTGVEVGKDVTLDELRAQDYKAFFLGIGASKGAAVGCPGDNFEGVYTGIDFLREVNLGKKPKIGKAVAVIGGGNVAIDVARTAVRLGAKEVTIVYRRDEAEMPAAADEIEEARAEGVQFKFLAAPAEIIGVDGKVSEIKIERMALGAADASGRCKPVGTGEFETLPVEAVISAIGQKVDLSGMKLTVTTRGTVAADAETCQTTTPDVFAGGDVVTGPKFAIDAIAAGKEAAISIHRYVHEGQTLTFGRDRRDYKALDKNNIAIDVDSFDNTPRQVASGGSAAKAKRTFKDLRGTFTEEQLKKETERCLGCGAVVVDENMCVGCGICTTKCKFDAIHLEKIHDEHGAPYYQMLMNTVGYVGKRAGRIAKKIVFNTKK